MHRSSESIGTIAAALAKAQEELTNPEKSLVATIRSPFPREGDRTFRYAPLSSGLDIVRKGLGRHEIATIQTTAIDKEAGLLRLTTVLAHSSGEWISSEWPVCQITDIASAQRMGAALTYARRYALFTLVGIAGEDDLDAPDLDAASKTGIEESPRRDQRSQSTKHAAVARARGNAKLRVRSGGPVLTSDQSAILRERLLGQLIAINSADEAAAWARENLSAKNTLTADDARIVEEEFQTRVSSSGDGEGPCEPSNAGSVRNVIPDGRPCPVSRLAVTKSTPWAKRFAYAIRSTGNSCPGRLALFAAGPRQIRITSRLCSLVRSETGSATSSSSRFVGSTTASFIARVTKPRGGASSASILYRSRSSYGSTHGPMAMKSHQAKASRQRLRRRWTYPSKIEPIRTTIRAPLLCGCPARNLGSGFTRSGSCCVCRFSPGHSRRGRMYSTSMLMPSPLRGFAV
jgi:ERF superfamily